MQLGLSNFQRLQTRLHLVRSPIAGLQERNCNRSHLLKHHHQLIQQRRSVVSAAPGRSAVTNMLVEGIELDDNFSGLEADGMMTIAGFGSLLSERSARATFPHLKNFRPAVVQGWRRVFAHTCEIFHKRGIACKETNETSSLSVEPCDGGELVVSLFEVTANAEAISAFIEREHEFKFVAVQPSSLDGTSGERFAVMCALSDDTSYRTRRCSDDEFERRYGMYGIKQVWWTGAGILPCRVYLRHCVLASQSFCPEAAANFLDNTFLSDRTTSLRVYLEQNPEIMNELPPPELVGRYSG